MTFAAALTAHDYTPRHRGSAPKHRANVPVDSCFIQPCIIPCPARALYHGRHRSAS